MADPARDTPAVAGFGIESVSGDRKRQPSRYEIARLLVGVIMPGDDGSFSQAEFREMGALAKGQSSEIYARPSRSVAFAAFFIKQTPSPKKVT